MAPPGVSIRVITVSDPLTQQTGVDPGWGEGGVQVVAPPPMFPPLLAFSFICDATRKTNLAPPTGGPAPTNACVMVWRRVDEGASVILAQTPGPCGQYAPGPLTLVGPTPPTTTPPNDPPHSTHSVWCLCLAGQQWLHISTYTLPAPPNTAPPDVPSGPQLPLCRGRWLAARFSCQVY